MSSTIYNSIIRRCGWNTLERAFDQRNYRRRVEEASCCRSLFDKPVWLNRRNLVKKHVEPCAAVTAWPEVIR
jgi:hypothetical protein